MKCLPTLVLVALALTACAAPQSRSIGYTLDEAKAIAPKSSLNEPPSAETLAAADFGVPPADDYEAQVRAAVTETLRDPESARYRFMPPERGWLPRYHFDARVPGQPHKHGQVFGWLVPFGVNSKNGYGGYAGEEAHVAYFESGKLRAILRPGKHKDVFGYPTWNLVQLMQRPG